MVHNAFLCFVLSFIASCISLRYSAVLIHAYLLPYWYLLNDYCHKVYKIMLRVRTSNSALVVSGI